MTVEIPIRLVNALNAREHWSKRARRAKRDRQAAYIATPKAPLPVVVTITRVGKRRMDGDGLQAACKGIRDGIAQRLGADDADPRIEWRYQQEIGGYAVRVEVTPA